MTEYTISKKDLDELFAYASEVMIAMGSLLRMISEIRPEQDEYAERRKQFKLIQFPGKEDTK